MKMKRIRRNRKMLHMENVIHRHDSDVDVPVTDQEELLCKYITDEIEEEFSHLGLTCSCSWHNPGEERHIEIFVGIPEGDDPDDPKYANLENDLELFVNELARLRTKARNGEMPVFSGLMTQSYSERYGRWKKIAARLTRCLDGLLKMRT